MPVAGRRDLLKATNPGFPGTRAASLPGSRVYPGPREYPCPKYTRAPSGCPRAPGGPRGYARHPSILSGGRTLHRHQRNLHKQLSAEGTAAPETSRSLLGGSRCPDPGPWLLRLPAVTGITYSTRIWAVTRSLRRESRMRRCLPNLPSARANEWPTNWALDSRLAAIPPLATYD